MKTVVILGATPKEDRFAFMAMTELRQHGYKAIPVNPAFSEVLGEHCYRSVADVSEPIDTITLYVSAPKSEKLIEEIIRANPRRIILNPGAENEHLASEAERHGIEVVEGCTLVMLDNGTF